MKISIVDYGMGNLRSVQKAFTALDFETEITSDPEKILKADKIILPGVGAFRDAINNLNQTGLSDAVKEAAKKGTNILGICLGMQLMFDKSYENGEFIGLGLMPGEIVKFREDLADQTGRLKIPHMGWNNLEIEKTAPLFEDLKQGSSVYFVHSYYLQTDADIVSSYVTYGDRIAVSAQKGNVYATQFHPEKSGEIGLKILKNFGGLK